MSSAKFVAVVLASTMLAQVQMSRADNTLFDLSLDELLQLEISSASKSTDVVRDIPASVTILTRDDIELMGYSTFEELLMNVPGFYHIDSYEDFLIGVRGTVGGSIAFLVNGVQQHPTRTKTLSIPDRSRTNIPIESIDRVEIVRGPGSVIYGNNAFFGSINVITNDHSVQASRVSASVGENNYRSGFARVAIDAEEGYSVLNIGGYSSDGIGGDIESLVSPESFQNMLAGGDIYTQLDGTLVHDMFSADLSGEFENLHYGFRYSDMHYGFYALNPGFDKGNRLDLISWSANLEYNVNLSANTVAQYNVILSEEAYYVDPDFFVPDIRGYQRQGSNRTEVEALLSGNGSLHWVAGVNYQLLGDVHNNADIPEIGFFSLAKTDEVTSTAAFANLRYDLNEKVQLSGGLRVSNVGSYDVAFTTLNADDEKEHSYVSLDSRVDNTYKLAASWSLTEQDLIKLVNSTATQDNSSVQLVDPEFIRTTELNYLHSGKKNTVSVSLFENDIQKLRRRIVRLTDEGVVEDIDNNSHWITQGVEFVATARPMSRLMAEVSGVYQNSEDKTLNGESVAYSPESQFKFKLGYGLKELSFSASVVYVSDMFTPYSVDVSNPDGNSIDYIGRKADSYTLINGNVRYQKAKSPWYVKLHGFNLADNEFRYPANELTNFEYGAYGPGRRLVLTFGYDTQ